jgi:hypothetical protein
MPILGQLVRVYMSGHDMLQSQQIEELITLVGALDKSAIIHQFNSYQASFPVDFTREFLETQSVDRLRHLFVAICLHTQRMPECPASAA